MAAWLAPRSNSAAAKTNTVKFTATEAEHRPVKIVVNSFKLVKLVV